MSALAFLFGAVTVGVPGLIVLRYLGYTKDSRHQRRRIGTDGRTGGRRVQDKLTAST